MKKESKSLTSINISNDMNHDLIARIKTVMAHYGLSQNEFAKRIGVRQPNLSTILKGERTCGAGILNKILLSFDIQKDWLFNGEGQMLKSEVNANDTSNDPKDISSKDEVPEQFISYLVPMAAMGGSLVGFESEGVRRENCERVISPIANADWVVPVCGDSMEPEYPNGSRVYVQQIYPDDFIAWGNVFVLDTTNGIIIKVVKESEKKGCVRCESLNPSGRYAPFDVPMRSIRAMYRVMLCVSVK